MLPLKTSSLTGQAFLGNYLTHPYLVAITEEYSHDNTYFSPQAARPDDARSVTRNLRNLAVSAPIRSKCMYCNIMFTVATYLVEKKSGLSFSDYLQQKFFRPLGMHSTNLQPEGARAKGLGERIAMGHNWDKNSEEYQQFQTPDCPEAQGAGSIITSVNDYIKWVKAMMNHEDPITKEIYNGLIRARTFQNPSAENLDPFTSPPVFGAGWEVFFYRGYMVVNHDGAVSGFGTYHFFLPDFKFGGAIFGNSGQGADVATILARELIDEVLKVPAAERPDWNKIESECGPDDGSSSSNSEDEELRQKLCPGITESEPQKMPLSAYTGEYWNPGYRGVTVQVENNKLFVDATDRSMGFTLTFDHVCEQTKYIAHLSDVLDGGDEPFRAEFRFENDKPVRMGLHIEPELEELIWFDRVHEDS